MQIDKRFERLLVATTEQPVNRPALICFEVVLEEASAKVSPDGIDRSFVRLGAELTGKPIGSSRQSESIRRESTHLLDLVCGDQKPRMLVVPRPADVSRTNLMLVLPLINHASKVEQLLAGAFFSDQYFKPGSSFDEVIIREIDG